MRNLLISYIIPTYERPQHLVKSCRSILCQETNEKIEIIIINDGSSVSYYRSLKVLVRNNKNNNKIIRYVKTNNRGRSCARNFGIQLAKGDFIVFLDDDDVIYPHYTDRMVRYLKKHPQSISVYCNTFRVATGFKKLYSNTSKSTGLVLRIKLLFFNWIPNMSVMYRKEAINDLRFSEELTANEDYEFLLRAAFKGHIGHETSTLCEYVIHDKNTVRDVKPHYLTAPFIKMKMHNALKDSPVWSVMSAVAVGFSLGAVDDMAGRDGARTKQVLEQQTQSMCSPIARRIIMISASILRMKRAFFKDA